MIDLARRIGFGLIIFYIFVVIAVQFALATNTVREVFTSIDRMEGLMTGAIIDNIGTVEVELQIEPFEPNNLRILVNGKFAGRFDEPNISIAVRNNSLIEIDATNEENQFYVRVSSISDNAMGISRELEVVAYRNIAILGKIFAE